MNRKQSGRKGGRATLAKHGYKHFQEIGRKGGRVTQARYRLEPIGQSGFAMCDRETNRVIAFVNFKGR